MAAKRRRSPATPDLATPKPGKHTRPRPAFELVDAKTAGIDIGSNSHFVAVRADRDGQPVRAFKSTTDDLERLAASRIQVVAMDCRGV